jgi:putative tricarboxylic transport membrane protein
MKKYSELIFGILMLMVGVFYLFMSMQIPRKGEIIDATFFPFLLSGFIFLLSFLQVYYGIKQVINLKADEKQIDEKTAKQNKITNTLSVIKTFTCIVAYLVLLNPLGFIVATTLYLVVQFIILAPIDKKKNFVLYAGIAVCASVIIYLTFRYSLKLMLPQGLIKGI